MSRVVMECDLIHPVGEVIFNALSTFDPNEQWPGTTWIRLKACGLFGVDENDSKYSHPGTYIGENEHILTEQELAGHVHFGLTCDLDIRLHNNGSASGYTLPFNHNGGYETPIRTNPAGGNQPHNNVQRSYLGYYWLRTA